MKKQAIITLAEIRKMANQGAIKSLPDFSKAAHEIFNRADLKGFVIELHLTEKIAMNKRHHTVNVAIINTTTGELRSFDTTRVLQFSDFGSVFRLGASYAVNDKLVDKQVFTAKRVRNTNARIFESESLGLDVLASYETVIAIADYSKHWIYLQPHCWNYSNTTNRHLSEFLRRYPSDWRVCFSRQQTDN